MPFDYLVSYRNSSGEFRTYGGVGHMVAAGNRADAIDQVERFLPPQVAATWETIQVRRRD